MDEIDSISEEALALGEKIREVEQENELLKMKIAEITRFRQSLPQFSAKSRTPPSKADKIKAVFSKK
ncbi:MAG: hypothetical protein LBN40_05725 [Oscillospiraceae bacterium]|jgi:hypothetical protein|nr:hypothetical protein [Oscillospiraceae bacterium]